VDGQNRHERVDGISSGVVVEAKATSLFVHIGGTIVSSSSPTKRDTFWQCKANTSRAPSMHADYYVARERNNDGMSRKSNVVNV